MGRLLPIVAVQTAPAPWDPPSTYARFVTDLHELHHSLPRARIFVYPELYLHGFGGISRQAPAPRYFERVAEPIPGPLTTRLCALAAELEIWLLPGTVYERGENGRVFNTALAISPRGEIAARYRKCFPWRPLEETAAGETFVVFDIDDVGRAGLMVCYDGWFPEVARHLAWMGAEVLFQPSATLTSDREQELVLARANAIFNQTFVVNVNMAGPPGPGRSIIVDPEGHPLQVAGAGEEHMTEVIDLDAVSRTREYGSVGLNRMWEQLESEGRSLALPLYGGRYHLRTPHKSGTPGE